MAQLVTRIPVDASSSALAHRRWWDAEADAYVAEHDQFLADDLVWGPEGARESELGLLGPLPGRRVLEVGCGAGQGARWCATRGADAMATDLSLAMLRRGRPGTPVGEHRDERPVAWLQCDAQRLPLADRCVDVVFSAYGALPFLPDGSGVLREAARVLRPGGRCVFSVTHPVRWAFPDVPGEAGLTATGSYFDSRPYVELDASGQVEYVEHHRTLGDRVREITSAGLRLVDLVEPEWNTAPDHVWGGWSRLRGRHLPGTAIFVTTLP